jgi:hypothetical protein
MMRRLPHRTAPTLNLATLLYNCTRLYDNPEACGRPVLQQRVPEDTLARLDTTCGDATRSAWLKWLIDRELTG